MNEDETEITEQEQEPDQDPAQAVVPLTDDLSQRYFDQKTIFQTISQVRDQLAVTKVNFRLARAGLLEGANQHPNQFLKAIGKHQKALTLLVDMAKDLEDDPIATIPTPPVLVYDANALAGVVETPMPDPEVPDIA